MFKLSMNLKKMNQKMNQKIPTINLDPITKKFNQIKCVLQAFRPILKQLRNIDKNTKDSNYNKIVDEMLDILEKYIKLATKDLALIDIELNKTELEIQGCKSLNDYFKITLGKSIEELQEAKEQEN